MNIHVPMVKFVAYPTKIIAKKMYEIPTTIFVAKEPCPSDRFLGYYDTGRIWCGIRYPVRQKRCSAPIRTFLSILALTRERSKKKLPKITDCEKNEIAVYPLSNAMCTQNIAMIPGMKR